jgi:hypothetical protein
MRNGLKLYCACLVSEIMTPQHAMANKIAQKNERVSFVRNRYTRLRRHATEQRVGRGLGLPNKEIHREFNYTFFFVVLMTTTVDLINSIVRLIQTL